MIHVNLTFKCFWRFKDHHYLKVTKCKKIINTKTGKLLNYHVRGYFVKGIYIKRKDINKYLEKIPRQICPF